METVLKINLGNDAALAAEAIQAIRDVGLEIRHPQHRRDITGVIEVFVALGSVGAFAGLYQIVSKLLEKNKNWTVEIETEQGKKIIIKGPTLPGVKELLEQLRDP